MFRLLGLLVIAYALYAAVSGSVYAKDGASGRLVLRDDAPEYFWLVVIIYLGLGIALVTLF